MIQANPQLDVYINCGMCRLFVFTIIDKEHEAGLHEMSEGIS